MATMESGFSRQLHFFGLNSSRVLENACNVDDAIQQAGLNWEVAKIPAGYEGPDNRFVGAGEKFWMTQRQDTGAVLGQVGAQYGVFQNNEAFAFADELLGFGAEFEAGGSWNGGSNVFLVAKLPQGIQVEGEEDMQLYLQMLNTHNGSGSISWYCTPVRINCTNQNRMAIREAVSSAKIRHTRTASERIQQAAETLRLVDTYKEALEENVRTLQQTEIELEEVDNFLKELTDSERTQNNILETYNTSESVTRGNRWGLFNSVTETLQWSPARRTAMETRFASNLDGPNQRTVERASRLLLRNR